MSNEFYVYELIDATACQWGDPCYPLAVFLSLKGAIDCIKSLNEPFYHHEEDEHVYEVRERTVGELLSGVSAPVVAKYKMIDTYSEEKDDNYWKLEECDA